MTVQQYWRSLSEDDKAIVKRYYDSIQPFEVLPSPTLEFDGEFTDENGEPIWAEINLYANLEIDDMFCTCGAGGYCVHLATMMYDMVDGGRLSLRNLLSAETRDSVVN